MKGLQPPWAIVVVLLVLRALGMLSSSTLAGLIHVLLVVAVIGVPVRLIQGCRVVREQASARRRAHRDEAAACS